jgi:hypothetical protein
MCRVLRVSVRPFNRHGFLIGRSIPRTHWCTTPGCNCYAVIVCCLLVTVTITYPEANKMSLTLGRNGQQVFSGSSMRKEAVGQTSRLLQASPMLAVQT